MCDCITKTTENLQKKIREDVELKTIVSEWIDEGRYQNIGYPMSGGDIKIGMSFIGIYVRQKKDGNPELKDTKIEVSVYPSYCPFCGKKYKEENKD